MVPIPGAKNAQQASDNAGALGWRLTASEVEEVGVEVGGGEGRRVGEGRGGCERSVQLRFRRVTQREGARGRGWGLGCGRGTALCVGFRGLGFRV